MSCADIESKSLRYIFGDRIRIFEIYSFDPDSKTLFCQLGMHKFRLIASSRDYVVYGEYVYAKCVFLQEDICKETLYLIYKNIDKFTMDKSGNYNTSSDVLIEIFRAEGF